MTKRSIALGLICVMAICGLDYLNSNVLQQAPLIGNSLPLAVYGCLIILVIGINPLLGKHGLSGKEVAVALAITLAGAAVPGGVRTFFSAVVVPHHMNRIRPSWRSSKVMDSLPEKMLVNVSNETEQDSVVSGFLRGLSRGGTDGYTFSDVPWSAWSRTLIFWLPILLTMWIALIGLSLVIHKQWSENERLPYPIATFTDALLPKDDGRVPDFFRNRMFWIAAGLVMLIHLNNYFVTWFPEFGVPIQTILDFRPLVEVLPVLQSGGGTNMLKIKLFFVIIGLAYFIPKEVSLSFGLGPYLWYILAGILMGYGINLTAAQAGTSYWSLKPQSFALFGANLGMFVMIIYNGRQFYKETARQAIGLPAKSEADADQTSILGLRIFAVMFILLLIQLMLAGVELLIAIPYVLIMIMGFVVMGRVIAESGLIYIKCYFWPCALLWGSLGVRLIGPQQLMILMMLSTILFLDPREALLPFMSNSLKVLERQHVTLKKPAIWCCVALFLGLAVAVPANLYFSYRHGSSDRWALSIPEGPFENATMINNRLASTGITVDESSSILMRLTDWSPNWPCVSVGLAGLLMVIVFAIASQRIRGFPLHPLMFITWASTPLRHLGPSFLIGWGVKVIIVHYGGSEVYNKVKPVMYGLIAGEILGGVLPILIGTGYYFITGDPPRSFRILP